MLATKPVASNSGCAVPSAVPQVRVGGVSLPVCTALLVGISVMSQNGYTSPVVNAETAKLVSSQSVTKYAPPLTASLRKGTLNRVGSPFTLRYTSGPTSPLQVSSSTISLRTWASHSE